MNELITDIRTIMEDIAVDLGKAEKQNKAAAQRVRVDSIKLEKLFKEFRKRSLTEITGMRAKD